MDKFTSTSARQIAQPARVRATAHGPCVHLGDRGPECGHAGDHAAQCLVAPEKALTNSPAGAAPVQEFHRQLFNNSAAALPQEIKRITGVEVREATAEVEPTTGTVVQVYRLASSVAADTWSGKGSGNRP
jgi:Na+-translocating membrane potential-generating system MpsC-like protein